MDDVTRWALAARDGDRAALVRFVRATQPDVRRFCTSLSDAASADDLTQETYLRALGALGRFRGDASARTWLLSIARNVAADALRKRGSHERLLGRLRPSAETASPPDGSVHATDLLGRLDPDRRAAFTLTQMLGLSYADAADVIGCPVGTIRSRVARARQDLVRLLRDDGQSATG